MNKLNITGNTFPLTVENLQVLQSQTELIQSALLASINKAYSGVATSLYLIVDNKENIVCAYYMNELYAVVNRGDMTKAFIVEKNVSVSTDTETFSNIRTERYVVLGNKEANETIKKTFYNTGTTKNIETINLISNLTKKISEAQSTADTASTTATAASSVANSATTTANNASAKANTASNNANTALENSNTAISTANSASEKANTATSTANTALEKANTATSTANTALDSAKEANKTKTYIVKGKITEVSDDYPNQTLMGTVTINSATKEMYLHFKCWSDGKLINMINIEINGSSYQFPNFAGNPISNKFASSHNNEKFFQYLTLFDGQYVLDFNLYLSMGGTGYENFYSAIEAELKKNNKLILYVNIPYE